ncbi:hypothetical protein L228DRAFT_248728 [Xylona heveae TC161]|uniref:Uncharacterized protein n=1 Tax=Xylona heveae (strain CBS 132557 / TC161) TaxID=1328760 RepID=A0A165FH95_XYLHT|nr:hypothetical protein L228DRAFT_248728 [Xylona heveae TC161]KZF20979.1 hypothetical protein L228DRAFT_248728 [Xylona heveae TC161]
MSWFPRNPPEVYPQMKMAWENVLEPISYNPGEQPRILLSHCQLTSPFIELFLSNPP